MSHCCLPSKWKIPQCCRHPQAATHSGTEYTSNEHMHTHTCTHQANEGGRLPWGVCRVSWRGSHFDRNGSMDLDQCTELLCPLSWQCTTGGGHIRTDTGGWHQVGSLPLPLACTCPSHPAACALPEEGLQAGENGDHNVVAERGAQISAAAHRTGRLASQEGNTRCNELLLWGRTEATTDTQHLGPTVPLTQTHTHTRVHVRGVP